MNSKLLIPVLFTTVFTSLSAQADLVRDARAHQACLQRLEIENRKEGLRLRAEDTYRAEPAEPGSYRFYLNARSRAATESQGFYRVECRSLPLGKVVEFSIEPGRWVYERPVDTRVAGR